MPTVYAGIRDDLQCDMLRTCDRQTGFQASGLTSRGPCAVPCRNLCLGFALDQASRVGVCSDQECLNLSDRQLPLPVIDDGLRSGTDKYFDCIDSACLLFMSPTPSMVRRLARAPQDAHRPDELSATTASRPLTAAAHHLLRSRPPRIPETAVGVSVTRQKES
jgi:hypothetical protein